MNSGIYKLYWKNNDYFYYGQAVSFYKRKSIHYTSLRKNKHPNRIVQNVFNKYGFPEMEIIELCERDKLNEVEQKYIDLYFNDKNCCNLCPSARNSLGIKRSNETKMKISLARTGLKILNPRRGHKLSEKHKENIGNSIRGDKNGFYGKKHSNETKDKLKKASSTTASIKQSIANLKFVTKESIEKGRINRIGWKQTDDAKKRIKNTLQKTLKLKKKIKKKKEMKFKKTGQLFLL